MNYDAGGAYKRELLDAAVSTFKIQDPTTVKIQAFDSEFDDYADVSDDEFVPGPTKIKVLVDTVQVLPVQFSSKVMAFGGEYV